VADKPDRTQRNWTPGLNMRAAGSRLACEVVGIAHLLSQSRQGHSTPGICVPPEEIDVSASVASSALLAVLHHRRRRPPSVGLNDRLKQIVRLGFEPSKRDLG
jgi:hypothetical protein